jgi:hypothetical protein
MLEGKKRGGNISLEGPYFAGKERIPRQREFSIRNYCS